MRNMQQALLYALLTPYKKLAAMQDKGDFTGLMAAMEALKLYPLGDVWDSFCETQGVPLRDEWLPAVLAAVRQ